MTDDDKLTSAKVTLPKFNGKQEGFMTWWMRFRAYAAVVGFTQSIGDGQDPDLPRTENEELSSNETIKKKQEKALKCNRVAMASFTMAFTAEQLIGLCYKAMTTEWPTGLASLVVRFLKKKYNPEDIVTKIELRRELNAVTMGRDDDPETMFEAISLLTNKYRSANISEEDQIAVILENAPPAYASTLTAEQRARGADLTMEDLSSAMNQLYRTMYGTGKEKTTSTKEVQLATVGNSGGSNLCYNCGKPGHKAYQCPEPRKPGTGFKGAKFNGTCNYCGKNGHKEAECWRKPGNEGKAPSWFRRGGNNNKTSNGGGAETGLVTTNVEVLLSALDHEIPEGSELALGAAVMGFPRTLALLNHPNVFVADSGASVDSTPHKAGLENQRPAAHGDNVTVGNGALTEAKTIGTLRGTVCTNQGERLYPAALPNVKYIPANKFNLFAVTKRMMNGWELGGNKDALWLRKENQEIKFDIKIPTKEGCIFAVWIERGSQKGSELELANLTGTRIESVHKSISYGLMHQKLGHMGKDATIQIAEYLGYTVQVEEDQAPCEHCAVAKAKQKNVPKITSRPAPNSNAEMMYLDLCSIKQRKQGPKVNALKNWRMMVDGRTGLKFSAFFTTKSGMVEPTLEQWGKWKNAGIPVQTVRMDNAGENKTLEQLANSGTWQLGIKFEYTAQQNPQMNGPVERGFATCANRGRALMAAANLPEKERYAIGYKAMLTASKLDGLAIVDINGEKKTRYEHFFGKLPGFAHHLRTWGEAGTVKVASKTSPKILNRGVTCMMVGYSTGHAGDCYDMWNPSTGTVYVTRDVVWLQRMYFPPDPTNNVSPPEFETLHGPDLTHEPIPLVNWSSREGELVTEDVTEARQNQFPNQENPEINVEYQNPEEEIVFHRQSEDENSEESEEESESEDEEEPKNVFNEVNESTGATRSGRTFREPEEPERGTLRSGRAFRETDLMLTPAESKFYRRLHELNELSVVQHEVGLIGAALGGGFEHTSELKVMNYKQAMATPDAPYWEEAVDEEHQKMVQYGVFKEIPRSEMQPGERTMTSTWAMKMKSNGTRRARIAVRGFEQKEGVQYYEDDKAAPVVNDITIRIVLVLMIMAGWASHLLDVKGAFLNGRFENGERVIMEVPQGFKKFYPGNVVLLLVRTLYGLKQAAIQYWREMNRAFEYLGYERSKADPCMQYKWIKGRLIIWLLWVDDCLIAGPEEHVLEAKESMKELFDCDDVGAMTEYVGCKVERDKQLVRLTQPVMLQSFQDEFDLEENKRAPRTPAEAGDVLSKGENLLSKGEQTEYRSGVGKLLHMMRWTRPEIYNRVRELSRFMSGATEQHLKAMKRVMKYCVTYKKRGLTLRPQGEWDGTAGYLFKVRGKSDSEYAKDESRKSVNGWAVWLNDAPVSYRSKMMPIIALSVTEAELFAATQCAMDMLFAMRVLNGIGLKVELPMILEVDNKAAVDLCNNWSIGGRTRHVEVKQYFLRELKERGLINVKWISGESMTSDIFTKNLAGPLFDKHAQSFVGRDDEMVRAGDVEMIEEQDESVPKGRVSEYLEPPTGRNKGTRMWNQVRDVNSARNISGHVSGRNSASNSAGNSARNNGNLKSQNSLPKHDQEKTVSRNQRNARNQASTMKGEDIRNSARESSNSAEEKNSSAGKTIKKSVIGTKSQSEKYRHPE